MTKVPLTVHGAQRLRDELKFLKNDERPRIVGAIAEARGHGDLKENAEYHAAKDEQGLVEARIRAIESVLSNADIIDVTAVTTSGKVVFGATVDLYDEHTEKNLTYRIVGEDEADISGGLISFSSPLGRALIGKQTGDVAEVKTPGGLKSYEILAIKYV